MIQKSLKEIKDMCLGYDLDERFNNITISGVCTDSRNIKNGQLFVPLVGDKFDGHNFIDSALEKGAAGILSSRSDIDKGLPTIFVKDTLKALQKLAQSYIEEINPKVICITGSNGKTSTKDILSSLLETQYITHKTSANFNNHIGVPLTILDMDTNVQVAVIEMGISDFGDMAELSSIAKPDAGIITNVSGVHLDDLINVDNVAKAKMEFLDKLKESGLYLYFKDDATLDRQAKLIKNKDKFKIETFGEDKTSDFIIDNIQVASSGSQFSLSGLIEGDFFLDMIGRHQVYNATAAIAMAKEFGISIENIHKGLKNIDATGMRNELKKGSRFTILDDSYKSNPDSLNAALDTLYSLDGYSQKIAIIGDMLGLGDEIEFIHRDFGKKIDANKLDMIIGIGYYSEYIIWEAESRFGKDRLMHFEEKSEEMIDKIRSVIKDNALVLVKASRPLELDTVVRDLLK